MLPSCRQPSLAQLEMGIQGPVSNADDIVDYLGTCESASLSHTTTYCSLQAWLLAWIACTLSMHALMH